MNSSPYSIGVFFLTSACNMHCSFCITDDTVSAMRYTQAQELLQVAHQRRIDTLVLGGGEPFFWQPGVLRLAAEAKRQGFTVQIGTNGFHLPADYAVAPGVDRYVMPLDSMDPGIHNHLRQGVPDHHALILRRLEELRQHGKTVTVSTVVNAQNLLCLPRLRAFLTDYVVQGGQLHAWHLYQFIPEGRGGARHAATLRVTAKAYHAACAQVRHDPPPFTIYKRTDMRHSRTVDFFWYQGDALKIGSEEWRNPDVRTARSSVATAS